MSNSRMKLPLFDDYWIDFRIKTVRRWFSPERWSETEGGGYSSLVYDSERKVYRLFYEYSPDIGNDAVRYLKLSESKDLKTFTPVYGKDGSDIIFAGEGGVHGVSIMYDIHETDPSRRYKFCGMTRMDEGDNFPVVLAFSADGVEWEHRPDLVANPYTSDALNKLFYNPVKEEYVLYHRATFVDRRIAVRTSKDLITWSDPHIVLQPGPNYNDEYTGMQHYSMVADWFDGIFYGLVWRFNTCLYDKQYSRMYGYMEPELVYSYDGTEFMYTSGKTLIERPYPPEAGCAGISPQDICESIDGENYFILTSGTKLFHGTAATNKELADKLGITGGFPKVIYKIRKDGFCGIESVQPGGELITKGIELEKDDLEFNIRANCGTVRFGIMNNEGEFFEGFSYDDCIPYEYDDSVSVKPKWKEHKLSELTGQRIRIAVELNTAILHCITATAHPFIRQPIKSFGDPRGDF